MKIIVVDKVIIDMKTEKIEVVSIEDTVETAVLTEYLRYIVMREAKKIIEKEMNNYKGIEP